jgi:hypothetical protein
MEPQIIAIEKPCHSAYEKFMEITNTLTSEPLSDQTHSEVEAYLETDDRELLRLLLQEHVHAGGPWTSKGQEDVWADADSTYYTTHSRFWFEEAFGFAARGIAGFAGVKLAL